MKGFLKGLLIHLLSYVWVGVMFIALGALFRWIFY